MTAVVTLPPTSRSEAGRHRTRPVLGVSRAAVTIRTVQVVLGALWLLDGMLQLQPSMFGSSFVTDVLAPAAHGQPSWLGWFLGVNMRLVGTHVAAWNALFACVQILIGVGLLVPSTVRLALALGGAWSVGVWVLGEGAGMLPTGTASPLSGAPGAVLLYGLVGLMAWPAPRGRARPHDGAVASPASESLLGLRGGRIVWAALWCGCGALWLAPANTAHGAIGRQIAALAAGEPGWLAHLDQLAGRALSSSGPAQAVALALVSAVIGLGPVVSRRASAYLAAGALVSLAFWVVGQDLGGILTAPGGTATDPNAGPLFVLMAVALAPRRGAGAPSPSAPASAPVAAVGRPRRATPRPGPGIAARSGCRAARRDEVDAHGRGRLQGVVDRAV